MVMAPPKTAIVLIAHGSRHAEANADLVHFARSLQADGEFALVAEAYLELASPTILEAAEACVAQGARRLILLPYFLSAGVHVERDLSGMRLRLAERWPDVDVRLAAPIGRHGQVVEVLRDRAREANR
jgi:sirohydrochlorin ferrochelatase